jgi:hypothetical protein
LGVTAIASFPDPASAQVAGALIHRHGIAVHLEPEDMLAQSLSPDGIRLLVPSDEIRRVRWLLEISDLPGFEYLWSTTGELVPESKAERELSFPSRDHSGFRFAAILFVCVVLTVVAVLGLRAA